MITIYVSHFAYQTTNVEVADNFVKLVESLGFEVRTELTEYAGVIDGLEKIR